MSFDTRHFKDLNWFYEKEKQLKEIDFVAFCNLLALYLCKKEIKLAALT